MDYPILVFGHLLLFVYWLGADVGVFALALALKNPRYSPAQRVLMMRMSLSIDMVPRMAMATIGPVGLHLAARAGWATIPDWVFVVAWIIAALWIIGEWMAYFRMGQPSAVRIYIFNAALMLIVLVSAAVSGLLSVLNGAPFMPLWLAVKVLLFGGVFLVSILMAVFYAPLEAILGQLSREGSSDEIEAAIRRQVNRGAFFTVLLFLLLATMGFLGSVKPF